MKIYFAHSQLSYNTPEEEEQRSFLETIGTVICPNRDIMAKGKKNYQELQNGCDVCVCSEFMGFIGRGVASGVIDFLANKKPVKVIRKYTLSDESSGVPTVVNRFVLTDVTGTEPVHEEPDWKVRYATLVCDEEPTEGKEEGDDACAANR